MHQYPHQYPPQHRPPPPARVWTPYPVVYAPAPYPGARLGMSPSLRSRARAAGAISALLGQLGLLLLLPGLFMGGVFGLNWVVTLFDDSIPLDTLTEDTAAWAIIVGAAGFILLLLGTFAGQLFAAACGIHRAGATAWWGSTLFNIVQVLAYVTGVIFILPVVVPMFVLLIGFESDTETVVFGIIMLVGAVINSIIGMMMSGLLWQWMAWAHRPSVGQRY